MFNCGLVILALLSTSNAGYVKLGEGLSLEWNFPDSQTIDFDLSVSDKLSDAVGWVSVGLKSTKDAENKVNVDGVYVNEDDEEIEDVWTLEDGIARTDTSLKGKDSLDKSKANVNGSGKEFSWSRNLNTDDSNDLDLFQGDEYYLYFGSGNASEGLSEGSSNDIFGNYYGVITLSKDFGTSSTSAFLNFLN